MRTTANKGFTIVELLVVISIIGLLISLLMPAVQAARESGRRLQCINNLKQISLAILNHEGSTKRFPTGGWGSMWVGVPERGNSEKQPGGWIYNILPFIEQDILHNLGNNMKGTAKLDAAAQMIAVPLPEFICPTRRASTLYPYHPGVVAQTYNASNARSAARTDYAINRGDFFVDPGEGPRHYDDSSYRWPDTAQLTGISFVRSTIRIIDISDGLTNTYLVGEKYLNPIDYSTGKDLGDDSSIYQGDDFDIARHTAVTYYKGNELISEYALPLKDSRTYSDYYCFGSAHPSTWQASFCDGSVHSITYDIDKELHCRLGSRNDGMLVDKSKIME